MKIAVLMSSYNGEKYIREQIESILKQNVNARLDLWVRDDGSTDATQSILEEYANNKKLIWYSGNNLKSAGSFMNLLFHSGDYDYYAFADQDDVWMSDKLQKGIDTLMNINKPALYCANAMLVDQELKYLNRNVYQRTPKADIYTLACAGGLLGCTMIFNHYLAETVRKHDVPTHMVMHDFYIAMVCATVDGYITYDDNCCMRYRQHSNNVVGVSRGFYSTLKSRLKDIFSREPVGIDEQAKEILEQYGKEMNQPISDWLSIVSNYKASLKNRLLLALSQKTKYMNKNMSLKLRMSILFGNR